MKAALFIVAVVLSCQSLAAVREAQQQPNILVLVADDLGYGELGCQGNHQLPTPNIDSIAFNGVRFTQGYVSAPNCSPSRAGFLTGKIQTRFGYEFNPLGANNEKPDIALPLSETTIAQILHDVGYTTGLIGKWHLGMAAAFHPQRRGFDEFFGFLHEGHFYVPLPYANVTSMLRRKALPENQQGRWLGERLIYSTHTTRDEPPYDANNPILRGSQPVDEKQHLTDAFTREAVDFISRHGDKPFFLYVAYNAVHSPLQGADSYMNKLRGIEDMHRRIFLAMLAQLDHGIGQVLQRLRREKLEENTLVFFFSDNGGPTRELTSSNRPLRGEKNTLYEGGIRVPFMVQWKGHIPAGKIYDKPVISLDVFATAARVGGAHIQHSIDGVDLLPYIRGENNDAPHETLYWRQGARTALRKGDWKVVSNNRRQDVPKWELYNLAADLEEQHNLATEEPDKLKQLVELWKQQDSQMVEPIFK